MNVVVGIQRIAALDYEVPKSAILEEPTRRPDDIAILAYGLAVPEIIVLHDVAQHVVVLCDDRAEYLVQVERQCDAGDLLCFRHPVCIPLKGNATDLGGVAWAEHWSGAASAWSTRRKCTELAQLGSQLRRGDVVSQ